MTGIPNVLIIEDQELTLKALVMLLRRGLDIPQIRAIHSAEEGLAILNEECFSIILSDYQLGGMDGVTFLESLRATGNMTPVILMSGAPDKSAVLRATRHPGVDFLGKPFPLSDLIGSMKRLTGVFSEPEA